LLCKVPIFFIRRLGSRRVYQKRRKKWGLSFKKIGDDVIAQKAVTSFKQGARHGMAFFKIKSTCPSDFLKNITLRYYEFCSKLYVHTVFIVMSYYRNGTESITVTGRYSMLACKNE
jgi:hypothetical protein